MDNPNIITPQHRQSWSRTFGPFWKKSRGHNDCLQGMCKYSEHSQCHVVLDY